MFTVMIVDDEPLIRQGLQTVINWEEQGFAVGATAEDAKDALAKLERCAPQLMIVDIRMPGVDGLELMKTVRESDRNMRFLILSGYADFEFARKAMLVGADGYMLKPVDEEDLIEHLCAVRKSLELQLIGNGALSYREAWLQAILVEEQPELPSTDVLEQLDLLWPHYQVLLVQATDPDTGEPLPVSFYKPMTAWVQQERLGYAFEAAPCMAVLLRHIYRSELQLDLLQKKFQHVLEAHPVHLALVVGDPVSNLLSCQHSYKQALIGMKRRFFMDEGCVALVCMDMLKNHPVNKEGSRQVHIDALANQLTYTLDIGSRDDTLRLLEQGAVAMSEAGLSELEVKHAFVRLLTTSLSKTASLHSERGTAEEDKLAWLGGIHNQPTLKRLLDYVCAHLEGFVAGSGKDSSELIVKQMVELIHRHYGDSLKLESLGDVFHYNSAYLGKLFKSRTGEYFNTYLDKVRIEKAKELLEEGKKVYQVAEQVGYTNVDYFHTKFKKYTGKSPSSYRRK